MTSESLFLIGFFILILVVWSIPITREILKEHQAELIMLSSAYIFLLADIKSDNQTEVIFSQTWEDLNAFLIVLGVLLAIMSIVISAIHKKKLQSYKELSQKLVATTNTLTAVKDEYYKLCSDHIKYIFEPFFIGTTGNGRVSLYKHEGDHFKLLGRYSNNPKYNKRGEEAYSDMEGFLSKGWEEGTFQIYGIPGWIGKSGTDYSNFVKNICTISDERLKKLTMKSQSFYIYRFDKHNAQNPYGIIVFEKVDPTEIQTQTITDIFNSHGNHITALLKSMKSLN